MARLFKNVAQSLPAPDGGVGPLMREYALPIAGILLRLVTLGMLSYKMKGRLRTTH